MRTYARRMALWSALFLTLAVVVYDSIRDSKDTETAARPTEAKIFSQGGLSALPEIEANYREDKVLLGRALFEEKKLSKTNSVSCSSCHDLNFYGADSKPLSIGINGSIGSANAPTVFNSSLNFRQFWDGRAKKLADQITGPIHNPIEMGSSWPEIVAKLSGDGDYRLKFANVYGHDPDAASVTDAIVSFESTLITPNAAFDRYLKGDVGAMSERQLNGFRKFQNFGCIACHQGANVGGNMYQTLGVMGDYFKDRGGTFESDRGRFAITGDPEDLHVFRVPSLRNVAMTPPYFHDGQVQSLDRAIRLMAKYQLGRKLTQEDVNDLVAFLSALTGDRPESLRSKRGVADEPSH